MNLYMAQDIKFKFNMNLSRKIIVAYDLSLDIDMYKIPEKGLADLSRKYPIEFYPVNVPNKPKYIEDASIYWGNRIELKMLDYMPKLDWVHFGSVGTDRLNSYEDKNSKLIITSSKGLVTQSMITYVISLMGIFSKRLDIFFKDYKKPLTREIYNKYFGELKNYDQQKVLIIGLGEIGIELAKKLSSLGVVVDAISRSENCPKFIRKNFKFKQSHDYLKDYDFVISLLPQNKSTNKIINSEFLKNMSSSSTFINIGRGSTVNEFDLVEALEKNHLSRAILDVSQNEPINESSILCNNENIFLTPHIASFNPSYWEEQLNLFEYNLNCFLNKKFERMRNLTN